MTTLARLSFRVLAATALLFVTGCAMKGEVRGTAPLRHTFKDVLAFDPPETVTGLRAAYFRTPDSSKQWLSFRCDEATLSTIRGLAAGRRPPETGFAYLHGGDGPDDHPRANPQAPVWWQRAEASSPLEQIMIDQTPPHRSAAVTDIWIDAKNRTVYARKVELN